MRVTILADDESGSDSRGRASKLLAFAGTFALVLAYCLRGGAYDVVVYEEYGLVIWWVLAVGIATGLLPRTRPTRVLILLLGAMLAYAAWTALSLIWTESSELTMAELARAIGYLGLVALVGSVLDRDTWRAAAAGLACAAVAVCALAVSSRLFPGAFPVDLVAIELHTDRLSYPFGFWNAVAAWGAMSTAICLAWSVREDAAPIRSIALAFVPVTCLTTYLTYSRAGVGGTMVGVIVVIAFSRNRLTAVGHTAIGAAGAAIAILAVRHAPEVEHASGTRGAAAVLASLALAGAICAVGARATYRVGADAWHLPRHRVRPVARACAIAVLVAAIVAGPSVGARAWHSFNSQTAVTSSGDPAARELSLSGSRSKIWKVALASFEQAPMTGSGAGTFEFWWNLRGNDAELLRNAVSLWFDNISDLGGPGLLLILTMAACGIALGVVAIGRIRPPRSAGVALLAAFGVFLLQASVDWIWQVTAVTGIAFAGLAVLGASLGSSIRPMRWYGRASLVALAVLAGAVQIPGLLGTSEIRASKAAERAGNSALALSWAQDAVAVEPWAASAYDQRALVLESMDRLTQAAADLRRAISDEPTNYVHWLLLARVEMELGRLSTAYTDITHSYNLAPRAGVFLIAPIFYPRLTSAGGLQPPCRMPCTAGRAG